MFEYLGEVFYEKIVLFTSVVFCVFHPNSSILGAWRKSIAINHNIFRL
ncbi:hypothetical protein GNIT_3378 [Glaciecola nitratireducens FR1064]|uniref:Uncharacterized protein n=1 Tax=Glaciecola nitratireducens (strain JCM 12485 / KCTC 12276 / FR1064) TaxID=1085623 RepID=G4QN53_GLANF|nr:hypothetical protein GNIT_3378 [Glaciecola nitratireducens FR1064]